MSAEILGVDPSDPSNEELAEAIETEETEQPQGQETAQEATETPSEDPELEQLREKARLYDQLDNDPELVQKIVDHYRSKRSGVAPDYRPPTDGKQQGSEGELSELRSKLQAMEQGQRQLLAMLQVQQFAAEHPDFNQYKAEVGKLLQRHPSFSLDEAYEHVKTSKARSSTSVPPSPKALAEGSNNRAVTKNDDFAARRRKVIDRNAVKSLDEAFDLALQVAQEEHRNRGE